MYKSLLAILATGIAIVSFIQATYAQTDKPSAGTTTCEQEGDLDCSGHVNIFDLMQMLKSISQNK